MNPYHDLLDRIAEWTPHASSVRDLPELSLNDLAVALRQHPGAFLDALADGDPPAVELCAERLGDTRQKASVRYAHVGLVVVGALRAYLRDLILKDVQALLERRRELNALEELGSHFPKTDEAQELMTELGLGRLSS